MERWAEPSTYKVLRIRTGQRPLPRALGEVIRLQRSDSTERLELSSAFGGPRDVDAGGWPAWRLGRLNADVTNCSFYILTILLSET